MIHNPFYKQWLPTLEDLFKKRLLANRDEYPLLDLQIELISCITSADWARKKYVHWKELLGKAIGGLKRRNAPLERIKLAQCRLQDMQEFATAAESVGDRLRSIGDGIAWRFLDYDRVALRLLAEHEPVCPPQMGRGLVAEVSELLRLALAEGHPALLNSISNFLRVGDITTFDKTTGNIRLIEVKAGAKSTARTRRQHEYMALVQGVLNTGYCHIGSVRLQKMIADSPLRTYASIVERAMHEAEERFGASRLFGEHLSVAVFSTGKIVDSLPEKEWPQLWERLFDRLYAVQRRDSDVVLPPAHNLLPLCHFSPILAPYAIFPIEPSCRFDLLTGHVWAFSCLNVSGLARWLEKRGWTTELVSLPTELPEIDEFPHIPVLRVGKAGKGVELGLDTLMMAAFEFWMPESIETIVAAVLRNVEVGSAFQVNFPNTGRHAWD